jgi:tetratricopeptide (TPR) repeat protein
VEQRDDLTLEYVCLLNQQAKYQEALSILLNRNFHPWEGGEGRVTEQYVTCLVELAKEKISAGDYTQALAYLERARVYPPNLGEGKLYGKTENQIYYYMGVAYEGLGVPNEAKYHLRVASGGNIELHTQEYYNDSPASMALYQGLALMRMDRKEEAISLFMKIIAYGESHLNDDCKPDYFAVSLPDFLVFDDDLNCRNRVHCHYLMGLGYLGLNQNANALIHFDQALEEDTSHLGAFLHRKMASLPD